MDSDEPVLVVGIDQGATAITAGNHHTCALVRGGVQCWGDNEFGQVGNGITGGQYDAPVDVLGLEQGVTALSAGSNHTCAVTESGSVWCWGSNDQGQLGINTGQTPLNVLGFGVTDIERHHLPWLVRQDD